MSIQSASRFVGLLALIVPFTLGVAAAQNPVGSRVPIHGFTGTLALPESVDKFYSDVNKIIIATSDGISHLLPGSPAGRVDETQSLESLRPGTAVVVQYTVKGISASTVDMANVGMVTSVDKKEITLRLSSGATQRLRLTQHSADDPHTWRRSRVMVYSSDESGQRRVHSFKPVH